METTHNSVKVKLGIKVMKLVESLIGSEVTVGQGSECHLTFVRRTNELVNRVCFNINYLYVFIHFCFISNFNLGILK